MTIIDLATRPPARRGDPGRVDSLRRFDGHRGIGIETRSIPTESVDPARLDWSKSE